MFSTRFQFYYLPNGHLSSMIGSLAYDGTTMMGRRCTRISPGLQLHVEPEGDIRVATEEVPRKWFPDSRQGAAVLRYYVSHEVMLSTVGARSHKQGKLAREKIYDLSGQTPQVLLQQVHTCQPPFVRSCIKCSVPSGNPTATFGKVFAAGAPARASGHADHSKDEWSNIAVALHVQPATPSRVAARTRSSKRPMVRSNNSRLPCTPCLYSETTRSDSAVGVITILGSEPERAHSYVTHGSSRLAQARIAP
jgi:hypothetical protein